MEGVSVRKGLAGHNQGEVEQVGAILQARRLAGGSGWPTKGGQFRA
jgi:hypothetical protein